MLAPFYWPEQLSSVVQAFVQQHTDFAVSDLVEIELFSALARRVRAGDISATSAQRVAALFVTHLESGRFERFAVERMNYATARAWLSGFQLVARTLDALHLAVAFSHDLEIATTDAGMARAGAALGMQIHHVRIG